MATSEREELHAIIAATFEGDFGARASHGEVYQSVIEQVPAHIIRYFANSAIKRQVTDFFNKKKDGLPYAPVVNDEGQHVPVPLMDFSEYEYVVVGYVRKAGPLMARAHALARDAKEKFGRPIVVDGVDMSASEAAA